MTWLIGLDLGQTTDPTALAILRQHLQARPGFPGEQEAHYACLHLQRWHLGTPYTQIVADTVALVRRSPLVDPILVIDRTGVGRGVYDMFVQAQPAAWLRPIVITGGHAIVEAEDRSLHVPKKELCSTMQAILNARRFVIAGGIPNGDVLKKELGNFKVKVTPAANETFGAWRDGQHDDLVLAVALATWVGENGNAAWDGTIGMPRKPKDGASIASNAPQGVFPDSEPVNRYEPDEVREQRLWAA